MKADEPRDDRTWMQWLRGEWWWYVSRHLTLDTVRWKVAWWVPRKIALLCFVRVYACTGDAPGEEYSRAYTAWERGAGK